MWNSATNILVDIGPDGQAEEEVELLWLHQMKRVGQHLSLVIFRHTLPKLAVDDSNVDIVRLMCGKLGAE